MSRNEMILALGNALLMLESVETKGAKNLNALLLSMQQVRKVYQQMKEEETHDDD